MKCDKCLRERSAGDLYIFYYGNKLGSSTRFGVNRTTPVKTTAYNIAGHATAWICDPCVVLAQLRYLALVLVLPLLALYVASQVPGAEAVCAAVGMLLLIALPVLTFASRREFGEGVAIRARQKALRAQNYNAFLSTDAFKRMNIT